MIRNQWYVVLDSNQITSKPRQFKRLDEELVFWRDEEGKVHCLVDRCCHRGAALSKGILLNNGKLQCPFHGFEYDGHGRCTCIPANGKNTAVPENYKVPSYPVHEANGWIWIWWGDAKKSDQQNAFPDRASELAINTSISQPQTLPEYFPDIDEDSFDYTTVLDPWNAHYSRVLENQIDVVHVPFVHYNTIGRGNRTLVDGPGVQWINNRMLYTYVFNRVDDGTKPKKPEELQLPPPGIDYKLELIMPNLWQNRISDSLRIVAAFVPVDNQNTILYLRTYQKFLKIPVLNKLVGFIFGKTNKYIAHQDRRIVQTQTPYPSRLRGGEQLIQGDRPIVEYRKKRDALMHSNQESVQEHKFSSSS